MRSGSLLAALSLLSPRLGYAASQLTLTGSDIPTSLSVSKDSIPTESSYYLEYSSTVVVSPTTSGPVSSGTANTNSTTGSLHTATSDDLLLLVGGHGTTTLSSNGTTISGNTTATSTSSTPVPTNTRPCNGYAEFCQRNYSNITYVAAHNSPFVRRGNMASNQELPVTVQLNDGVRMLQFQTHYVNDTLRLCHSSCDLFDAGTLEDYLKEVTDWLRRNPYDVITILMGNSNFVKPKNYTKPIEASGLIDFVYKPPKIPMALDDWPPLSKFIMSGQRAILFMDYSADQKEVPYILDEFSQLWETPFSPTNRDFPCTVQRPPKLKEKDAKNRMYMANHNLNTEVSLMGSSGLLVPNSVLVNETNAVSGYGSAGAMAGNCTEKWGRPPNFILVDYYNIGNVNGSIFRVAAKHNNVKYNGKCCGSKTSGASEDIASILKDSKQWAFILMTATALLNLI